MSISPIFRKIRSSEEADSVINTFVGIGNGFSFLGVSRFPIYALQSNFCNRSFRTVIDLTRSREWYSPRSLEMVEEKSADSLLA